MQLSEQTKIEAQIAFLIGIIIGAMSGWMIILFFSNWQWYFKLFSSIGSLGIIGSISLSLLDQLNRRKALLEALKEMQYINTETGIPENIHRGRPPLKVHRLCYSFAIISLAIKFFTEFSYEYLLLALSGLLILVGITYHISYNNHNVHTN